MNTVVNRETVAMQAFSRESTQIANDIDAICSNLRNKIYEAAGYMQDESGQEAISIVEDLINDTVGIVASLRVIAERIRKSAELLEESDTLL